MSEEKKDNLDFQILNKIAVDIDEKGGRTFFVGGYVRDKLLKYKSKDIDVEVFGIDINKLKDILLKYGNVNEFGNKFGILKLSGTNIEFSMPRKEKSIGEKHQDFEIEIDPNLSLINASKRRDFTMNSLMEDVLTGEIIDYWNGKEDIENKVIRHIDDVTFIQDELRVLRACQFAARFNFEISKETINLCKKIDCSHLPKERIYAELEKVLLNSEKPSIFFQYIREIGLLSTLFKPLDKLIGLKQNPIYHPEGDVWNHTMMVLDEAAKIKEKSNYPICLMIACICHDLGKITTTRMKNGKLVSYDHENQLHLTDQFLKNITDNKDLIVSVKILVRNHMRPNIIAQNHSSNKAIRKLIVDTSGKLVNIKDTILLSKADRLGRSINNMSEDDLENWWENKLSEINNKETKIVPFINGQDLINLGFIPNKNFGDILDYAFKLQIDGLNKEEIINKIIINRKGE